MEPHLQLSALKILETEALDVASSDIHNIAASLGGSAARQKKLFPTRKFHNSVYENAFRTAPEELRFQKTIVISIREFLCHVHLWAFDEVNISIQVMNE